MLVIWVILLDVVLLISFIISIFKLLRFRYYVIYGGKYIFFINKLYICFLIFFFIIIELKKIFIIINFIECICSDWIVK